LKEVDQMVDGGGFVYCCIQMSPATAASAADAAYKA
jgi:hypothetical protein